MYVQALRRPAIAWRWLLLALALRVALSPLQHTWDSQTWWNVAAELGGEANPLRAVGLPYETMRALSDLARGSGQREFYEYWAYPPLMLLLWWPVARLWTLLAGPLAPQLVAPDVFTAAPLPFALSLGMKAPTILGDLAAGLLLARLAGRADVGRGYLLNPYVLLAGLWAFDGLMVALLLGGLLAAERGRWALAGTLLGLGAAVKLVPLVLVAAVALWALRVAPTPLRSAAVAVGSAAAAFGAISLPWLDGVLYVLRFHAERPGGGLSWQGVWGALAWSNPGLDLAPVTLYLSAQVGTLTLGTLLLLATWLAWWRGLDLLPTSLALLLAYLAGSKLVNEVYPLPALALALAVQARRPSSVGATLATGLWVAPLLFALVNVPAWGFLLAPALGLGWLTLDAARAFHVGYQLTYQPLAPALALAGAAFQVFCVWGLAALVAPAGRRSVTRLARAA